MRLKHSQVAVFFLLCCSVGCDGVYRYSLHGQMYEPDGVTPATHVPLYFSHVAPSTTPTYFPAQTDAEGRFDGEVLTMTGWVLAARPPAPKLSRIFVTTPDGPPAVELNLAAIPQPISRPGRDIRLPRIILKRPTSGPATNP